MPIPNAVWTEIANETDKIRLLLGQLEAEYRKIADSKDASLSDQDTANEMIYEVRDAYDKISSSWLRQHQTVLHI